MNIDWSLVIDIAVGTFLLIFGFVLSRLLERKAKVVYYLGHVSVFKLRKPEASVYTHSIVVWNSGNKTAKNVIVGHLELPRDFTVFPTDKVYDEKEAPGGGKNIVFPKLVPKETITISYLYYPPLTYQQVNSQVKHDDGFGKMIPVLMQKRYQKWQLSIFAFLTLVGIIPLIYFLIWLIKLIFLKG